MQSLSEARTGDICTIKWMLGNPEALEVLHSCSIEEGSQIRVIQQGPESMIIGTDQVRLALGHEVASRIKI